MLELETVCPLHVLLARQGCSLSPLLYLINDEAMIKRINWWYGSWNFSSCCM